MKPFVVMGRPRLLRRFQFVTTRDFWIDSLHLFPLCGFAVAQPIYDLLGQYPEFLAVRGSRPVDILLLTLALSILLPLPLILFHGAAAMMGRNVRKAAHAFILTGIVSVFAMSALKELLEPHSTMILFLAGILGVAATAVYLKYRIVRRYVTILSPAAIIIPVVFLLFTPVNKLLIDNGSYGFQELQVKSQTPIFLVIFDELPLSSLMDEDYQLDRVRYPNFAKLADFSYWFRNATTNSPSTSFAIPAMLTGKFPERGKTPRYNDYPNNIFTLLSRSYRMAVSESVTWLCPAKICKNERYFIPLNKRFQSLLSDLSVVYLHIVLPRDFTGGLPSVTRHWGDFGDKKKKNGAFKKMAASARKARLRQFDEFLSSIRSGDVPGLYFIHSYFPHMPSEYLPSGKTYSVTGGYLGMRPGNEDKWGDNEYLINQSYQRHLLQVGFVDKLVGKLIDRIRAVGLFERSLIIVTSDHGLSFRKNNHRRKLTNTNYQDILWVPLLIKTPQQSEGFVVDKNVESIDILPSVADILGVQLPWPTDGQSVIDPSFDERLKKKSNVWLGYGWRTIDSAITPLFESVDRKVAIFRSGDNDSLYHFGDYGHLVGTQLEDYNTTTINDIRPLFDQEKILEQVHLGGSFIPAHISGRLLGKPDHGDLNLALVKDDTIVATTETYNLNGEDTEFSFIIPESVFHDGDNRLDLVIVEKDRQGRITLSLTLPSTTLYALSRSDGKTGDRIMVADGEYIHVEPGVFAGRVERIKIRRYDVVFNGWAYDNKANAKPVEVLLFLDGEFQKSVRPTKKNKNAARSNGIPESEHIGFSIKIPIEYMKWDEGIDVNIFAVSANGTASELPIRGNAVRINRDEGK